MTEPLEAVDRRLELEGWLLTAYGCRLCAKLFALDA
jgi:hypothetical protein